MFHCKHSILLVNLIGHLIALASCNCQLKSMRILSQKDLLGTVEHLSLPGQSLSLVAEDGDRLYLGGRDAVYELRTSNISDFAKVAAWPSGGSGGLVRSLFFPGHSGSGAAFVCAIVGDGDSRVCRRFNRGSASAGRVWRHSAAAPVNRQISALLLPPAPSKKSQPPPVSLRLSRGNSRVFFAALPPIREATDLVELTGPEFADIGFTTADLYSRRSRALWMARGARAHVMHEVGDRMYAVYTEPAAETSNYVETVNTERSGLVQIPTFTRLARICLNDPGQTLGNRTSPRVLTSFFKLRLVCRHDGVDYDVLELATPVSDGQFIGLFARKTRQPAASAPSVASVWPTPSALLTGDGDFIELSRRSWQSPLLASRLSRENFPSAQRRVGAVQLLLDAGGCAAEPPERPAGGQDGLPAGSADAGRGADGAAAQAAIDRRPTALTLLTEAEKLGVETDQLLVGW
uniref:Sema domain-containing protein n=1 Tax=Macrostomum lignano TaxID=282301 RepID=A0A1I8HQS7_9PLAT